MSLRLSILATISSLVLGLSSCNRESGEQVIIGVDRLGEAEHVRRGLDELHRGADESALRQWVFGPESELAPWTTNAHLTLTGRSDEGFQFEVDQPWPLLETKLDLGPDDFNAVLIRLRSAGGPGHSGQVVWNWSRPDRGEKRFFLHGDQQFHDYLVVLGAHPRWQGDLVDFGINPLFVVTSAQRSDITIERIALLQLSPASLLRLEGYGPDSPRWIVRGESRTAIALALDQREKFILAPDSGSHVVLEGNLPAALARENSGARFEAWVLADGERHRLLARSLSRTLADPDPRFRETVSLRPWAGRRIELELRITRSGGGVRPAVGGFWVEPRLIHRASASELPRQPRRIILVTVDTLRADHLTPYGAQGIETPFFEELARRGTRFDVCYATSNATNPSHASILTSLYLQDHGIYDNETALAPGVPTLAAVLRDRGYRTAAIVSAPHLAPNHSGLANGFDIYDAPPPLEFYPRASETTERALNLLEELQNEPLFLWVHYFDPHIPYRAPEPFASRYYEGDPADPRHPGLGTLSLEPGWEEHPYWSFLSGVRDPAWLAAQYRSEIAYVDAELLRLMRRLDRLPGARNTLVAVTADHGESLGEHGVHYEHFGLHDTVTRVPLFLVGPGIPAGTTVNSPVSTLDLFPTVLDLVPTARRPELLRGQSLLGYLRRPDAQPRRPIYLEHAHQWQVAVRSDTHKLIATLVDGESHTAYRFVNGDIELYDLSLDPGELNNRADLDPALVRIGRHLIKEFHDSRSTGFNARPAKHDPAMAAVLRQLGYTGR